MAHMYFLNDFVSRRNKLRRGGDEEEDRVEKGRWDVSQKLEALKFIGFPLSCNQSPRKIWGMLLMRQYIISLFVNLSI